MVLLGVALGKNTMLLLFLFCALVVTFFGLQYAGIRAAVDSRSTSNTGRPCPVSEHVDWTTVDVNSMTSELMVKYFEWTNRTSCRLVHDFGGRVMKKPSGLDGQKAICLDPVQLAPPANCIVYSFGINDEWSFDDAMAKYGCQVYAFDPSMKADDHDRSPSVHFFKFGLSSRDSSNSKGWRFRTLTDIYEMVKERHGEHVIDYLKMDIEYDEWVVIPHIIATGMLDNIRQLAIEVHLPIEDSITRMRTRVRTLRSLENRGMVRFDSKMNPWYTGHFRLLNITGPRGYEIAWYNNKFL